MAAFLKRWRAQPKLDYALTPIHFLQSAVSARTGGTLAAFLPGTQEAKAAAIRVITTAAAM